MPESPHDDLELGEIDDQSVTGSVASQKHEEVVFNWPGMLVVGSTNPMVNFQLLNYERTHDLRPRDATYQRFSYGLPTFLPREFLDQQYQGGADRRAVKGNLTGTADAAYDCLLEDRMKKVDVMVQAMQTVATPSGQQAGKLVHATVAITMPDMKPDMALGMIMLCCAPGFFPGTKVFTNAGAPAG